MSPRRPARLIFRLLMLLALPAVIWLASLALQQAAAVGAPEAWMMAWVLAFVVALPVTMVVLTVAARPSRHRAHSRTIPLVGVKIPGAGQ
ncbi:MAG TPA: hypothetical protein VGD21_07455 [Lysobacter sp.]